jgi:predicted transcriptional regulator
MKVTKCMTHDIEGIQTSDSISNTAIRMRDLDIGALAVFEDNRLNGAARVSP